MVSIQSPRPKVRFFVWSSFDYGSRTGSYYLLMKYGQHVHKIEHCNITGHSPNQLMLTAVIEALELMKKPSDIEIFTSTPLGLHNIYDKSGGLRNKINGKHNCVEKEKIMTIIRDKDHHLINTDEKSIVSILIRAGFDIAKRGLPDEA